MHLSNVGEIHGLSELVEAVRRIPFEVWTYRLDPESDKTRVVRENSPAFPLSLVLQVTEQAAQYLGEGYSNRMVLSCVPAGEGILPHRDDFGADVRNRSYHCHVPVVTAPEAVMGFPQLGVEEHLEFGKLYVMDESHIHYVKNPSAIDRVHLLFAWFPHKGKNV